jgi:hypothetical protein
LNLVQAQGQAQKAGLALVKALAQGPVQDQGVDLMVQVFAKA